MGDKMEKSVIFVIGAVLKRQSDEKRCLYPAQHSVHR